MKIGVVSDTRGLLRAEVLPRLKGVDSILHLGDVGDPAILDTLRASEIRQDRLIQMVAPAIAAQRHLQRDSFYLDRGLRRPSKTALPCWLQFRFGAPRKRIIADLYSQLFETRSSQNREQRCTAREPNA